MCHPRASYLTFSYLSFLTDQVRITHSSQLIRLIGELSELLSVQHWGLDKYQTVKADAGRPDDRQKVAKASAPSARQLFLCKCNYTTCLKNRKRKTRQLKQLLCKILTLVRFQSFFFLLYTILTFLYNDHMLMFLVTKVMFF